MTLRKLEKKIRLLRILVIKSLVPRESHHIGCSLSIVDIVAFLYNNILRTYPNNPTNAARDIFILSKGHGALAVYAVLCDKGFFPNRILSSYDKDGGLLPEHISSAVPGVEISTGSLGHGLSIANGYAHSFLRDKKNNNVYALLSDGELNEGSNWEAIMFAGHHKLQNLIVVLDKNNFQGYASTEDVINLNPIADKIKAFNWNVYDVDGHSILDLERVFKEIKNSTNRKPHFVVARTIKGKGVPYFEGRFDSHYKSIDEATKKMILRELHTQL